MDCYITLNGVKYIKEDVHKKQLETMKQMYEQKDVGMIPVSDIKFGKVFLDSHGKKFMKVDHTSVFELPVSPTARINAESNCIAVSLKTYRVVMFSSNQPVRPIEGN